MKEYEIWIEGWAANEGVTPAQYLGKFSGNTFQEACKNALLANKWDMHYYDEERNSYWCCRFFDNEKDARKFCG